MSDAIRNDNIPVPISGKMHELRVSKGEMPQGGVIALASAGFFSSLEQLDRMWLDRRIREMKFSPRRKGEV